MARPSAHLFSGLAVLLIVVLLPLQTAGQALSLTYCSSQNTGSDSAAKYWTWQSNGWCHDQCNGGYAYAVVQGNDCWCSNWTPQDQEDTSKCDKTCPGYPDEHCGSSDGKLFGYVKLDGSPSGTQNLPGATSSAKVSSTPAPSPAPSTSKAPDPATSQQPSSSAAPTTFQTSASSSAASSSTAVQQPSTEIQILTVSGNPVTKTVVYTPTSMPSETQNQSQKKNSSTGAIVGGVVGGIGLIAAIIGGVFFVLWRRRRQQQGEAAGGTTQSGVQRNTSTMSKAGLLGPSEKVSQYPPKITTNLHRNSRMMDSESISPISGSDRRHSRPYIFDQRLNPSAIMNLDNTSRGSFVSMDDARDYGRTLNVRNPDPDTQ